MISRPKGRFFISLFSILYICRVKVQFMKLSKTEEELMNHLWKLKKAVMKDLLEAYNDPKPATTILATLLKRSNYDSLYN